MLFCNWCGAAAILLISTSTLNIASHISRMHKDSSLEHKHEAVFQHPSQEGRFENLSQPLNQPSTSLIEHDEELETGGLDDSVDEDLFLKNLSLCFT